jgi:hypothetical protein
MRFLMSLVWFYRVSRVVLFAAGLYFLVVKEWVEGFGCLLVLLVWQISTVQQLLEAIRDTLRGFTDEEMFAKARTDANGLPDPKGLGEIPVLLRDIRNNHLR